MVQRTDMFGDVVEDEEDVGYNFNIAVLDGPVLLVFVQNNESLIKRLSHLPNVYTSQSDSILKLIAIHDYHIVTMVYEEDMLAFIGRCNAVSQRIVAIDLLGTVKLPDNIFKLDFGGRSDDYVFEYLKIFLGYKAIYNAGPIPEKV